MSLPLVVIAGRPNVGKSTLFNRLVGRPQAIVNDQPGVTRDRLYGKVDAERPFRLVDTGGLGDPEAGPFGHGVERQASAALEDADLVLLVVDAREGPLPLDEELAARLRRRNRPVLLVANKVEAASAASRVGDFFALGLGPPVPVSAEHAQGIDELLSEIVPLLPLKDESQPVAEPREELRLAIVGRPNVGKSSLFNRLVGEERALVSEVPGTTRDSIDTRIELPGSSFRLIDTAGLRRPGRVVDAVERSSVLRTRRNIEQAHVVLLVVDGTCDWSALDAHIAGQAQDHYRPLVVAVNKWDLVADREERARSWEEIVGQRLRFTHGAPVVFLSARTGQRAERVLELARTLHAAAGIRVGTGELNRWLQEQQPGGETARGGLRLFYVTQTGVHPPSFVAFCNDPQRVHFSMARRLANGLRERFGYASVPIRLRFRGRRESGKNLP